MRPKKHQSRCVGIGDKNTASDINDLLIDVLAHAYDVATDSFITVRFDKRVIGAIGVPPEDVRATGNCHVGGIGSKEKICILVVPRVRTGSVGDGIHNLVHSESARDGGGFPVAGRKPVAVVSEAALNLVGGNESGINFVAHAEN